jgi:hypothetical protein
VTPSTYKEKYPRFGHIVYNFYRRLYFFYLKHYELYGAVARLSVRQLHYIVKEYILLQYANITDLAKTRGRFNYTTN